MPTLETPIEKIPKINPKYRKALGKLGIANVRDLLFHFPFRYDDYSELLPISDLSAGETSTVEGEVAASRQIRTWKKKMRIAEVFIKDGSGFVRAVWFNQPFITNSLPKGKMVRLSGKVSLDKNGLFFSNPAWENATREPTNTAGLVPVYPETEGITSKWLRWQIQGLLRLAKKIEDPIPEKILEQLHLPSLSSALKYIHFPQNPQEYILAQKRFAFQEMLALQIASLKIRSTWKKESAAKIPFDEKSIQNFTKSLPFELTGAQKKAAMQIFQDLEKPQPMNRLLNGDVGSGKTLVAALSALSAINAGFQVSLMAPTEVLARQHFESISKSFSNQNTTIGLLTNSYKMINVCHSEHSEESRKNMDDTSKFRDSSTPLRSAQNDKMVLDIKREELLNEIRAGKIDMIIGTHAIIQKDVRFKNLALVIVDEQHRFSVMQRAYLQQEIKTINDPVKTDPKSVHGAGGLKIPHLLSMTATPIPRTLSLAFFGNLDISVLDEMPKNRKPIETKIINEKQREQVYEFVRAQIRSGRQAFVIFPLVEESKALSELKAATAEHKRLSENIFPDLSLGLLHGKLKSSEKEKVMDDFKNKKFDILVATSVVEVGIDVPNATVIIIEDTERFGLSQLHQFRGRVGRGEHQSYCFLFTGSSTAKTKSRLGALEKSNSGFDIAQKDLELRGPGQFLGTRQSGLPDITMENIANVRLIEISKKYAEEIINDDPDLENHPLLAEEIGNLNRSIHLE